ncbi:methylated-DNA--[protein]-cysteine S-methyltransferase [Calidithermus timidus]|jgi:methylated-DNA-[protein]-cysteine S-methyltransferase|uniref:methylated-DNA--[protein]-cysteine S-methyltransferase n=1 Tax=Calidithermus timidus TaxID=307124 RepID=UPI00037FBD78|nr:methylated-DNA--[protein]-cysteine S-methyltransferase [Calidithermus timidus]
MFSRLIPTPLGPLYAEASERGLTSVRLLVLAEGFPERSNALLERLAAEVGRYFGGEGETFLDMPLDYRGLSPERIALYERVRHIPFGNTTSYAALGRELALSPRAVGAGMRACPFFLVVPAQRVIHADGRLGGFMGAEGIKLRLLVHEGLEANRFR